VCDRDKRICIDRLLFVEDVLLSQTGNHDRTGINQTSAFRLSRLPDPNKDADGIFALKRMHRRIGRAQEQVYPLTRGMLDKLLKEKWSPALGPTAKF
jgi:hypothetical protein